MNIFKNHTFHIPVLGVGYSVDTPIKVAPLGISSVISLVDDTTTEKMREFYSQKFDIPFKKITRDVEDFRAKRITSYLNVVDEIVQRKVAELKNSVSEAGGEFEKYLQLLPDATEIRKKLNLAQKSREAADELRKWVDSKLHVGSIDVNIMTKLDKTNYKDGVELPAEHNDAHAALRGFANSKLNSSLVLSAGMSPRLYSYIENFKDFFPDVNGLIQKKIILKVSDFRSAFVQGKIFAGKGLWVSEYRIESGVNCGGHAFPTNGILFGPILEEFKKNRDQLYETCIGLYKSALQKKEMPQPAEAPEMKVTAQGGVGTAEEHTFLLENYGMDSVGWATPFMLVPEVISIDNETLDILAKAKEDDLYYSGLSPLGVPFNTVKGVSMSLRKAELAKSGKPGYSCTKGFLKYNTEFTEKPICTSSKEYQRKKLKELAEQNLPEPEYRKAYEKIVERECLCNGLSTSALISKGIEVKPDFKVTCCPGPNLAYFSKVSTLKEMVDHIYGRLNLLDNRHRPHMFLKELSMYLDIFKERMENFLKNQEDSKELKQLQVFQQNLFDGISYYQSLFEEKKREVVEELEQLIAKYPALNYAFK
jgi:tRNA-dihydrouridine synthase